MNPLHLNLINIFERDYLVKKYLFPYKESFYDLVNESVKSDKIFHKFYIIKFNNKPIGYVEIESPNTTYLNYALIRSERKKGYATMFIKDITEYLLKQEEVNSVNAIIRKNNIDSINVFKRLEFDKVLEDSNFETYKKTR